MGQFLLLFSYGAAVFFLAKATGPGSRVEVTSSASLQQVGRHGALRRGDSLHEGGTDLVDGGEGGGGEGGGIGLAHSMMRTEHQMDTSSAPSRQEEEASPRESYTFESQIDENGEPSSSRSAGAGVVLADRKVKTAGRHRGDNDTVTKPSEGGDIGGASKVPGWAPTPAPVATPNASGNSTNGTEVVNRITQVDMLQKAFDTSGGGLRNLQEVGQTFFDVYNLMKAINASGAELERLERERAAQNVSTVGAIGTGANATAASNATATFNSNGTANGTANSTNATAATTANAAAAAAPAGPLTGKGGKAGGEHAAKKAGKPCHFYREKPYYCLKTDTEKAIQNEHLKLRLQGILGTIVAIIVLGEVFHHVMHHIEHGLHHSPIFLQIFHHLLQELTVLGFIGTTGFILCRVKVVRNFDRYMFGNAPMEYQIDKMATHDYREGHLLSEMMVLFEDFHYLIFIIMLIYIATVYHLCCNIRTWVKTMEKAESLSEELVLDEYKESSNLGTAGFFEGIRKHRARQKIQIYVDFLCIRVDFVNPSQGDPPKLLKKASPEEAAGFSLAEYMKVSLAGQVHGVMSIPVLGLASLFLMFIVEDAMRVGIKKDGAAMMIGGYLGFSWIGAITVFLLARSVNGIMLKLTPPPDALERAIGAEIDRGGPQASGKREKREFSAEDTKAPYLKMPETHMSNSFFVRWWYGTHEPTQHEMLFWFGKKGPGFYIKALQMVMMNASVVITLVYWGLFVYAEKFTAKNPWLVILSLFPCLYVLQVAPDTLCKICVATSVGQMIKMPYVRKVLESGELRSFRASLKLILLTEKFKLMAAKQAAGGPKPDYLAYFHGLPYELQQMYVRAFNVFKEDEKLGSGDMYKVLGMVGFERPPEAVLMDWFKNFDQDGSGQIDLDEFQQLVGAFVYGAETDVSQKDMLKLWTEMDASGDGELSPEELTEMLQKLGHTDPETAVKALIKGIQEKYPDGYVDDHGHGGHGGGHGDDHGDGHGEHHEGPRKGNGVTPQEITGFLHAMESEEKGF